MNWATASFIIVIQSGKLPTTLDPMLIIIENIAPLNPLILMATIILKMSTTSNSINHSPGGGVPTPGKRDQKATNANRKTVLVTDLNGRNKIIPMYKTIVTKFTSFHCIANI